MKQIDPEKALHEGFRQGCRRPASQPDLERMAVSGGGKIASGRLDKRK
jgi:hypothetical protein